MEPKPSRLPRRINVQPSTSSPLNARRYRDGLGELYHSRDSSLRHDSDFKSAASSTQPTWYDPADRIRGTYPVLQSRQQEQDSKRPKLSYSGCSALSGIRTTTNGSNYTTSESSRYGRFPRTSPVMLGSGGSDSLRERERRPNVSVHGLMDYSSRNGDLTPSQLQDRVSSYAQGARPKDNSISTVRLNSSLNRQVPSQPSSSLYNKDSVRSSRLVTSRSSTLRGLGSSERDAPSNLSDVNGRKEGTQVNTVKTPTPPQRSINEQPTEVDGRRSTRHLLSRLASSMSSTFFPRRSSQDSLNARPQDAVDVQPNLSNDDQPHTSVSPNTDVLDSRSSEQSQGFAFLRRRRWGLSTVSPNNSSDSDAESYRSEDSESRTPASWLPYSFRNRCTPLFSRRRREGRDETARASSTSDTNRSHNPFRRTSQETTIEETQRMSQDNAVSSSYLSDPSSSTSNGALGDSIFSRRNSGMLPSSLLHFAMPATLGNALSDNVMITVDIIPAGRGSDGQESDNITSRDPEKLKKIQESLLLEDSEDDEGDLCRICQMGVSTPSNPFIEPCKCAGSLQYVHQECMKKWLHAKINSGSSLETITTCELCKEKLELNLEDFDIKELYHAHANERAEYEFISSGLYLVVLLHLCEQRFSDMLGAANEASNRVRFINLARTLQAHMDDLETSEEDSEEEGV
ncbi:E3 ubiquitin-protein ligase MARCHF7 isoform X2 [Bombina bombina]|uniref:E3 ubiquitin-protein ligase MARCHF7 isoform X2 n=1 Tax=Bombina bombina TaxID=8345 RepID=UPI00235B2ACD|nr:E3 ubiquitin-protein ligase MARCHF7 isoform X2 [Bombina bombina]